MIKTSQFLNEYDEYKTDSLTPIRDYKNDYFHKYDDKIPISNRFPLRNHSLLRSNQKSVSEKVLKRPNILDLQDISEPLPKRHNSPLNLKSFDDKLYINSPLTADTKSSPKLDNYLSQIKKLHESESIYLQKLCFITEIYRKRMHTSKQYKNKILEINSCDEVLLFGNIDTFTSICELFIRGIESSIMNIIGENKFDSSIWNTISQNETKLNLIVNTFNLGKLMNLNYLRIKSTYLSYCVTHKKQMDLLNFITTDNTGIFEKWNKECFMESNGSSLSSLLKLPLSRPKDWLGAIENILFYLPSTEENSLVKESLIKSKCQYENFVENLNNEMKEYEQNEIYNYSLTPIEIIQDYGNFNVYETNSIHTADKLPTQNKNGTNLLPIREERSANSYYSTSSKYSSYYGKSPTSPLDKITSYPKFTKYVTNESKSKNLNSMTLSDFIHLFKKIRKQSKSLYKTINVCNYEGLVDLNTTYFSCWLSMMNSFPNSRSLNPIIEKWLAHKQYLKLQKEKIVSWKILELQLKVLDPLEQLLEKNSCIYNTIKDFEALKKDYYSFLKSHKKPQNIQHELLAKHFIMLQQKLLTELPIYIDLVHHIVHLTITNYVNCLLHYFESLIGDSTELKLQLNDITNNELNQRPNLDIVDKFTIARYKNKCQVHEAKIVPESSKILRKFFEL
ncbi:hypothetical protein TPHA_0J01580 [Tetrapisispora phaffii CBS 4417]|uniref:DH domain-containing protein n=1 Tax=Tetrapisispora phaffii (strain ATCC 24235 / CBS 4417 / NBRC 1672 / NRRL Y-8282 / UCD 70-5) TaxID=1071381 RepID=G8BYN7_TETPH|nr:hypothetical protein TPHA_0J01580 [Tetrapisispora phaffii CBS 4417]CCE64979.1 hypothetical protein TPHA_0J01580 [Tetrapisispora phaffii CBS 4417]